MKIDEKLSDRTGIIETSGRSAERLKEYFSQGNNKDADSC